MQKIILFFHLKFDNDFYYVRPQVKDYFTSVQHCNPTLQLAMSDDSLLRAIYIINKYFAPTVETKFVFNVKVFMALIRSSASNHVFTKTSHTRVNIRVKIAADTH